MTPIPPPDINWLAVVPSGLLVLTAILVLFWDLWIQEEDRPHLVWLTISGFVLTGAVSFGLWGQADASGPLALDSYALFFNGIFCLAGVLTVLMSGSYLDLTKIRQGEYYALLLFAAVGMVLMAAATDLITMFLGLETMSIAVYVLAGIWHQRLASNEAALKYFLLGAFASGFLLYGMALIYGVTGSLQLAVIAEQVAAQGSSTLLLVGMGLLLVGFGFKVAAAPFHVWTPDVYEGSPTTITAFMAVGVKAAAFAAFARVFLYALAAVHAEWQGVVWVLAVLTMTVGNLTALVQTNIKRMLAYSSVAHAGYVLVAMVAGKELGGGAMLYYLVAYGFMNLGAFGVVLSLNRQDQPQKDIGDDSSPDTRISPISFEELRDYAGLGFRYPALGMAMAIFMLSLTGVPPLVGFTGKFYVFSAAVEAGYIGLAIIGVLNSAVSAYYYIRVIVTMYMEEGDAGFEIAALRPALSAAIIIAAAGTILLGIFPSASISIARESFLSLG